MDKLSIRIYYRSLSAENDVLSKQMNDKPRFSFLSGFWAGLGALAKLGDYRYTPPPINYGSVADDWKAVGDDMRKAMDKVRRHGLAGDR